MLQQSKNRTLDDVPVALAHRLDELGGAEARELRLVARVVRRHRWVVVKPRRDVLAEHAALVLGHLPHLERQSPVDEGALDEEVADVAGVCSAQDAGEAAPDFFGDLV